MKRTSIIIYLKFNNLSLTNLHFFQAERTNENKLQWCQESWRE